MAAWPYNTLHWRQVRLRVLARDGYRCQLERGCDRRATEVHHIVAPAEGGHPFAADNLQAACKPCNIAERNRRRARWARIHNGEELAADIEVVRPW